MAVALGGRKLRRPGTRRVSGAYAWDPTEPVATRPLMLQVPDWGSTLFYAHDGNKNVSEVFYYALGNGIAAHYDYAPFGAVTRTAKSTPLTRDILSENPFRFSSEVHDNSLGLVYYNYRHYNPKDGRWLGRDPIGLQASRNLFAFVDNSLSQDALGRSIIIGDALRIIGEGAIKVARGTYFIGKVAQTYAGAMVLLPTSILDGELLNEFMAKNHSRVLDFSQDGGCRFNISVNGMANEDGSHLASLVEKNIKQHVYPFDNPNNLAIPYVGGMGLGDVVQSVVYELGLLDIAVAGLYQSIEQAKAQGEKNGCRDVCIVIYAHSQGTMLTRRAFDLLKCLYGADHDALSKITFCGYGGETRISADEYGLRNATNVSNSEDAVTWWGAIRDPFAKTEEGKGSGHPAKNYFP